MGHEEETMDVAVAVIVYAQAAAAGQLVAWQDQKADAAHLLVLFNVIGQEES